MPRAKRPRLAQPEDNTPPPECGMAPKVVVPMEALVFSKAFEVLAVFTAFSEHHDWRRGQTALELLLKQVCNAKLTGISNAQLFAPCHLQPLWRASMPPSAALQPILALETVSPMWDEIGACWRFLQQVSWSKCCRLPFFSCSS